MNESRTPTDVVPLDEYESGRYVSQGSVEGFLPSPVNYGWAGDDPSRDSSGRIAHVSGR